jgi:hypothetical protein
VGDRKKEEGDEDKWGGVNKRKVYDMWVPWLVVGMEYEI